MFDRYQINQQSDRLVPVTQTVHHHNAPTVEQSRYAEELRVQVRKELLDGWLVELDLGVIHAARYSQEFAMKDVWVVTWKQGGQQRTLKVEVDHIDLTMVPRDAVRDVVAPRLMEAFFKVMSEELAWRAILART